MTCARSILLSMLVMLPAAAVDAGTGRTPGGSIPEITALYQSFKGTTTGSGSFLSTLNSSACSGFSAVAGSDVVYTWVAQSGVNPNFPLHLDFFVRPEAGFDAVVYALSELDDGTTCVAAVDWDSAGNQEMLHVEEQLIAGHRYYLYIDSRNPAALSGSFGLYVSTFIPVELQSFRID